MTKAQKVARELLVKSGLRTTSLRCAILTTFVENTTPLTVPRIQELLRKKALAPNKTSLYRHLASLCAHDIIYAVTLTPDITHYELRTHHHHHAACDRCGDIYCIEDAIFECGVRHVKEALSQKGFQADTHDFVVSGACLQCK